MKNIIFFICSLCAGAAVSALCSAGDIAGISCIVVISAVFSAKFAAAFAYNGQQSVVNFVYAYTVGVICGFSVFAAALVALCGLFIWGLSAVTERVFN